MRLDRKLTAKLSPRLEPAAKLFARYRVRKSRSMLFKVMAMFDFAVLVVKVLFFIWAIQLVWIGSRLLERPAKRVLRSVPKSHRSSASIKFLRLRSRHRSELFLR